MSNEGMALNFGFQTSNFKFIENQNSPSRISLRDFDFSSFNTNFDCRLAAAVNYLIDLHLPGGGQRDIIEIIGDFSVRSAGQEVKGCVGWQKDRDVSLSDVYLRREFFLFPPIV